MDDGKSGLLVFGDPNWSSYDLSLQAKRTTGNGFAVVFQRRDQDNWCWLGLGYFGGNGYEMHFHINGGSSRRGEKHHDNYKHLSPNRNQWYLVRIKVRKDVFECFVDDDLVFEESHSSLTHGRLGLVTFGGQARFRRIKIVDPKGEVMFDGLPEIASATETEEKVSSVSMASMMRGRSRRGMWCAVRSRRNRTRMVPEFAT